MKKAGSLFFKTQNMNNIHEQPKINGFQYELEKSKSDNKNYIDYDNEISTNKKLWGRKDDGNG